MEFFYGSGKDSAEQNNPVNCFARGEPLNLRKQMMGSIPKQKSPQMRTIIGGGKGNRTPVWRMRISRPNH